MRYLVWILLCSLTLACSTPLKYDKVEQLSKNDEFEKEVKIETAETKAADAAEMKAVEAKIAAAAKGKAVQPKATPSELEKTIIPEKKSEVVKAEEKSSEKSVKTKHGKKSKKGKAATEDVAAGPTRRQPEFEDDIGFSGRRPLKDPYHVGEIVTHDVHYFKVSAGTLKLKVEPMVQVNGRKAYNFVTELKTSSVFSSFYSVEDRVETFVDYETLVPRVYSLHVKETSQLREARMIFDENTNQARFWEKKVTEKNGEEQKKLAWDILPYSQNVYSAAFYMRNFQWEPGKEIAFRVADDEQNLIFKAKCLRREKLDTDIGEKDAVVIKPEVILKGAFKPVGDIYIWLSDDEHHYILRIESKIKIGTIISEITSLVPGQN